MPANRSFLRIPVVSFGFSLAIAMLCFAPGMQAHAAAATTTALNLSSSSAASGQAVTLTATVTAGGLPVAPGTVNFCDASAASCFGPTLLGTAQLIPGGTASIKLIFGIGTHSIKAVFAGTNAYAGSNSTAQSLTVTGKYPTSTTIASSGSIGNYTLTATVIGASTQAPTGTVSFLNASNGNALVGTAALGTKATTVKGFTLGSVPDAGFADLVAVGDFNGDGKPDLAVTNYSSNPLTIFLGNGDGTFTAVSSPAPGNEPTSIAVGDFNGDGKQDLAFTNYSPNTLTILLGNGDGSFTAAASPATGSNPASVAVGDFNGDGKQDLAVANNYGNNVTILLGNGDGSFTAAASPNTGNYPDAVAVGDFNGDGKQDLVVVNDQDGTVTILLGNGDGSFTATIASPATGNVPVEVVVGDFNGDGKQDLAVANSNSNSVTILLGNGDGTFAAAASPATGTVPVALVLGDFNGDGKQDLAVALYNTGVPTSTSTATIFLGNGDGSFTAEPASPAAGHQPSSIAAGDFNGDGQPDLVDVASASIAVLLHTVVTSTTATLAGASIPDNIENNVEASYPGNANYGSSISGTVQLIGTNAVPVTIHTSPQGLYVSVDGGAPQAEPLSFLWTVGSQHSISAITPEKAPGTIYTFSHWSDGGAAAHMVTAASNTTSYTASFSTQYLLITSTTPSSGGTMFPVTSGTYYPAGTVVPLFATPASGYVFGGWSGDVASPGSPVTAITMNAPENVTANFQQSLVVTTAADDIPTGTPANCPIGGPSGGNGTHCSLRDALAQSAAIGGARITFDATVFGASQPVSARTITLLSGPLLDSNPLSIPSNTAIIGPTTGSGNNQKGLVTITQKFYYPGAPILGIDASATNVSLFGLTITGGFSKYSTGSILNAGVLTITNSTISDNFTYESGGGGVYNVGKLTIIHSTFSGNSAANDFPTSISGGAIYNLAGGTVNMVGSTISSNGTLQGGAGAIYNDGTFTITDSTISGNGTAFGTAGAIFNDGKLTIADSTISNNGSGSFFFPNIPGLNNTGTLLITNTVLAGNTTYTSTFPPTRGEDDCGGTGCPINGAKGNIVTATPMLAPLGNYGGPTQTQPPLPGSPALCAGIITDIPQGVLTDQRGELRISDDDFHVCLDSGSVQTWYGLEFTQQPSNTTVGAAISPAPTVQLKDHGIPIAVGGVSIPLTLGPGNNGSLSNSTVSTDANGIATYSNLSVSEPGIFDILIAKLPLTSSAQVDAVSGPFNVNPATGP